MFVNGWLDSLTLRLKSPLLRSTARRRWKADGVVLHAEVEALQQRTLLSSIALVDRYENDDSASRATVIATDGTPQLHSIHNNGRDVDYVRFTLDERAEVTVRTEGTSGDTRLWLYGPDSTTRQVAYNDDGGTDYFSHIQRTLEPGTYYVKVD